MELTLCGEAMAGGGRVVARAGDEVWLVAGALPGETVRVRLDRRRAGIVEGSAVALIADPHPARDSEPCPHAPGCGGCDWPHVEPRAGAELKRGAAAGSARGNPGLAARLASAPISTSPLAYRMRSRLHWSPESRILGFYESRSWRPVAIPSCRIVTERLRAAIPALASALARVADRPVDLEWLEDLDGRKAVVALRGARGGPCEPPPHWLASQAELGAVVDGCHRLTASGALLRGWGEEQVAMQLPRPLEVPIGAFFQGNRHLVPWLFDRIVDLAGEQPHPTWDLHAGVGFLAAAAARRSARPLTLIEPFRPSARAAVRNLPEARVAVGRTAESWLARHRRLPTDALVLADPPRAGLSAELRSRLAGWHPHRIVMMSCDPATWTRDTAFLIDRGYRLAHLELADLFPSTHHVEVISVLEAG